MFTWFHVDNKVILCLTAALQEGGIVECMGKTLKNKNFILEEIKIRWKSGNSIIQCRNFSPVCYQKNVGKDTDIQNYNSASCL